MQIERSLAKLRGELEKMEMLVADESAIKKTQVSVAHTTVAFCLLTKGQTQKDILSSETLDELLRVTSWLRVQSYFDFFSNFCGAVRAPTKDSDFSRGGGGVHKIHGFWWVIFQRGST